MTAGSVTVFDASVRTLECTKCGAPLQCDRSGGQVTCAFCGCQVVVQRRVVEATGRKGPLSAADEVARVARLRAQVAHRDPGHPYDMTTVPPGLDPTSTELLRTQWQAAKGAGAGSVDQPRLCWIAVHLAEAHFEKRDDQLGRAVLETSLDLLDDPAHRQIIRCRLAYEAAQRGDEASAEQWLAECDSAPELLDIDTEVRVAAARLALLRDQPTEVLERLGKTSHEIPLSDSGITRAWALRVAAFEMAGDLATAVHHLAEGEAKLGQIAAHDAIKALGHGSAAAQERLRALEQEKQAWQARQQAHAARKRAQLQADAEATEEQKKAVVKAGKMLIPGFAAIGVGVVAVIALAIAGILLLVQYWPHYRPLPIHAVERGEEVVIEGRTINRTGILVRCAYPCRVVIRDCRLTADTIVQVASETKIEIHNSELRARNHIVTGDTDNEILVEGSTLEAGRELFKQDGATDITVKSSKLETKGGTPAIRWEHGLVTFDDVTLRGGGELLQCHTARLRIGKSTLHGGPLSEWALSANLCQSDLTGTKIFAPYGGVQAWLNEKKNLQLLQSRVVAGRTALRITGERGTVSGQGSHIEGKAFSINDQTTYGAQIALGNSTIVGPRQRASPVNTAPTTPRAAPRATPAAPKVDCNPPYTRDSDGVRIPNPRCL